MSEIIINIKGRDWRFILLPDKRFDRLHNDESGSTRAAAMTISSKYEVHFRKSDWDIVCIRHELLHVLFSMSLSGSADLTPDQVEEICAEIVAHHNTEITLWSDRIAERFFGRE